MFLARLVYLVYFFSETSHAHRLYHHPVPLTFDTAGISACHEPLDAPWEQDASWVLWRVVGSLGHCQIPQKGGGKNASYILQRFPYLQNEYLKNEMVHQIPHYSVFHIFWWTISDGSGAGRVWESPAIQVKSRLKFECQKFWTGYSWPMFDVALELEDREDAMQHFELHLGDKDGILNP